MPFVVSCRLCRKKFRTGASLRKHFDLRHHESSLERAKFEDEIGVPYVEPKSAALGDEDEDYLQWLGVLVERLHASLVPDHPGKCSILEYFTTL